MAYRARPGRGGDRDPGQRLATAAHRAVLADRAVADEIIHLAIRDLNLAAEVAPDAGAVLKSVLQYWSDLDPSTPSPPFSDRALRAAIPKPPSPERMMVLLVDVLGFSLQNAGEIVGLGAEVAAAALAAGRTQLNERRNEITALIIEDEALIAVDLKQILESVGVSVVGSVRSAQAAISIADATLPDVVLADYNLEQDLTGVEAVQAIRERHDCRVIYITGFPEHVLYGKLEEPDFIIVKPYRANAVKAAMAQIADSLIAVG